MSRDLYCSFCGKTDKEIEYMVAGPGVYICSECIAVCYELYQENRAGPREYDSWHLAFVV